MRNIFIQKVNGDIEEFDIKKVQDSLIKNGASEEISKKVCTHLKTHITGDCSTGNISKNVQSVLRKNDRKLFLRYNLPSAILQLGPEGFAFESFIGQVFESYKYSPVFVGKKIAGKCIPTHELDIVATKEKVVVTAELKFHNSKSKKTDLKVALYMKARFDDIEATGYYDGFVAKKMIITNTKFTTNAKKYSRCAGIDVLSWNFPEKDNLHDFILHSGVHPVTALESISKKAKEFFIKRKIVSCNDIIKNDHQYIKDNHFIPRKKIQDVIAEVNEIKNNLPVHEDEF